VQFLRWIADGEILAEEAVPAYHGVLQGLGIKPYRSLADDMQLTDTSVGYGGSRTVVSLPGKRAAASPVRRGAPEAQTPPEGSSGDGSFPVRPDGLPDFARMTPEQRLTYHRDRLNRTIG